MKYCYLDRAILKLSGTDSFNFLQSLTTNDIEAVNSDHAVYCLFLTPQARFLFDVFISKYGEEFYIDVDRNNSPLLFKRLNFYKLKSDVKIQADDTIKVIYTKDPVNSDKTYKDNRYGKLRFRAIISNESDLSNFTEDTNLYLNDKYEYGIPDGFIDLIYEKTLVPEFSLELLNAISFTKGCYTGQEVISRVKNQGVVRKKLFKLIFDKNININPENREITQLDNKVGYITSANLNFALAILNIELLDYSKEVQYCENKAKVIKLDWN